MGEGDAEENPEITSGANVVKGKVTYRGVSEAFSLAYPSGGNDVKNPLTIPIRKDISIVKKEGEDGKDFNENGRWLPGGNDGTRSPKGLGDRNP
jgi:hypothetical protein